MTLSRLQFTPCLWFDSEAKEAATYYTGIFPNSHILTISHYTEVGMEQHGRPPGSVMTVDFELDGQRFTALNGGPVFKFSEAVSFQIFCEDQAEIDSYWNTLGAGGDKAAQQCGWLKDKFGLSWQVVPRMLDERMKEVASPAGQRMMAAMMNMKKLDIATLEAAYKG